MDLHSLAFPVNLLKELVHILGFLLVFAEN